MRSRRTAPQISSSIHGGWYEVIGVAVFGDIPDAGEGEVIANDVSLSCAAISRTRFRVSEAAPGSASKPNTQSGWLKEIAVLNGVPRKEKVLAPRGYEKRRMSRRMATARYDAHTFDGFFAVFDENHAVFVGQQVLAR